MRLVQGKPAEALEDALVLERTIGPDIQSLGFIQWRTVAALAFLALGDRRRALQLADAALQAAGRTEVLHARVRAMRVSGLCEGGQASERALTELAAAGARPRRDWLMSGPASLTLSFRRRLLTSAPRARATAR